MNFLPLENISFKTELKADEIIKRLQNTIEPVETFNFRSLGPISEKPYKGKITGNSFEMSKIIYHQNSSLPQIKGVITSDSSGTSVTIKMRLHTFLVVTLWFFCGSLGFFSLEILTNFLSGSRFNPIDLIPMEVSIFIYLTTVISFKRESDKNKKYLKNLFEPFLVKE